MKWRDYVDIRVTGRDLYAFVNALRISPVACGEQVCIGKEFRGRILRRDIKTVEQLAADLSLQLNVCEIHTVMGRILKFRLRFGIILGLLLGAAIIFWQSNVVETIEIHGNVQTDERLIRAVLEEEGVVRGKWIGDIDMLHIERSLQRSIHEVAWAGMRRTGNRLVIEISEARDNLPMLHERTPSNIIAAHDAQIVGITVHSGMLCHLMGDGVVKGELLVSGVRTDEDGKSTFLHANGSIIGRYTREAELTTYISQSETLPTGRVHQKKWLRFFSLKLPLTPGTASFAECRTRQHEVPLAFLGFTLPCSLILETSEETATTETVLTEEQALLTVNADIVRFEKNLLNDVTILSRDVEYEITPESVTAHLRYQVEGEIGQQSEILLLH